MTSFELIDSPLSDDPAQEPYHTDVCECAHAGNQLPVLLSIEDGLVIIVCAICRRSFLFLDDLDGVSSDEIPMTLTYHDTTVSNPIVGTEYDGYWQLTTREVTS